MCLLRKRLLHDVLLLSERLLLPFGVDDLLQFVAGRDRRRPWSSKG
jgi:hypothetical protein